MRWARLWGRADDGGRESAVVLPSLGAALYGLDSAADASSAVSSAEVVRLQLTLWEPWA